MGIGLSLDILTGQFAKDMAELEKPIESAVDKTMKEVSVTAKAEGRANIASAGFSSRWQNALRTKQYKDGPENQAVLVYHKIQYAGVFEDGATITGKPLLWLPLANTPAKIGGNLMTVARLSKAIGPLSTIRGKGNTPLLGAPIRLSRTQAASDRPKVTLAALKRGKAGKGILRTVPLFVGIRTANIRKQLSIREICKTLSDAIPALYAKHFEE